MYIQKDVKYGAHAACLLDIYTPDCENYDVFLYFHGGGLEAGDKSDIFFFEHLLKKGIAVVSANYRMYPDAKFPEFIEDAAAACAFTQKQFPDKRLFVGGSSAGGYLSLMLCFDDSYLKNAGVAPTSIAGYIHDAGQPTTHFNILRERGLDTQRLIIDEAAPAFFAGVKTKCQPMLIIVSDNDMHCRLEQTNMFCKTLEHFGIAFAFKLMHGTHCRYVNQKDEHGNYIFADIIHDFICK